MRIGMLRHLFPRRGRVEAAAQAVADVEQRVGELERLLHTPKADRAFGQFVTAMRGPHHPRRFERRDRDGR